MDKNIKKTTIEKVSIIIPIYNSIKYLEKCLESALGQSYTNLEIILINDGSTDDSMELCIKYAKIDHRIVLFEQFNQGVSVARNIGLNKSSGKYITFMDADDFLDSDAIATMVELVEESKADVVRMKWREIKNGRANLGFEKLRSGHYSASQRPELLHGVSTGRLKSFSWLLIMRREFLVSNNILFPQDISMMEDTCFYIDILNAAQSVFISDKVTYNYVLQSESASRSVKGFADKVNSVIKVNKYLAKKDFSISQQRSINATHVSIVANMLMARVDKLLNVKRVSNMLAIVHKNTNVEKLYKSSDLSGLSPYHRLEVWAVMNNSRFAVQTLKLVRILCGR